MDTATAPKRGALREHILRTALHLFTQRGYFNTSVHDIQHQAQVSIGSIYNHFGGKEGIAKALYAELLAQIEIFVAGAVASQPDTYSRGRALVRGLFAMTEDDPETIGFVLNAKHREFLPEEPPICSAQPFVTMREIIQQGMERGEIQPLDLMVGASCAYGPALRMISLRLDGLILTPLPEYADQVWDTAWRAIRAADA